MTNETTEPTSAVGIEEERDCKGYTRAEHEARAKSAAETAAMLGEHVGRLGGHLSRPFTPCAPEDRAAAALKAEPDVVMLTVEPNRLPNSEAFDALTEQVKRELD
jgi:hypothetical protein